MRKSIFFYNFPSFFLSKWQPLGLLLLEQLPSHFIFCLDVISEGKLYTLVLPFSICVRIAKSKDQFSLLPGSQDDVFFLGPGEPSCSLGSDQDWRAL